MPKYILLSIVLLLMSQFAIAQSDADKERAMEYATKAVELMDEGKYDESIALLKKAQELEPENIIYAYELGYVYVLKEDYKKAVAIYEEVLKMDGINEQVFQMLGNSYSLMGNRVKALETYKRGLEVFPYAGGLYLEQGVVHMKNKDIPTALASFEKGIEMVPTHPSNYYWAAKLYLQESEEKVWGMLYGELFMNMERGSMRTAEISKLLYDTYQKEITIGKDKAITVNFSKDNLVKYGAIDGIAVRLPFGKSIYEPVLVLALANTTKLTINALVEVRMRFLSIYMEEGYNLSYPNLLFDFQKAVKDAGHDEAYNYWILSVGDNETFRQWTEVNADKWQAFVSWFEHNGIEITSSNKFSRKNY